MPPKLQRSNTLKSLLLEKRDSIRITDSVRPVRWKPLGVSRSLYDDFAHLLFEWGYWKCFVFVATAYLAVIILFALLLYVSGSMAGDDFLTGDLPEGWSLFEVCFWFSAVNVITTGFGAVVPASRSSYLLSCLEHFVGLLMGSLLLGIVVSKASLPTSKLVFSSVAVVRKRFGVPHLIFRVGNGRGNFLYTPEIRLSYIRFRKSPEGESVHTEAQLEVVDPVALKPVFFVQHALHPGSPLYGKSAVDLAAENGFIVLTISATDDMTLQTLHSRALYSPADIRWNHTFEDIIVEQLDAKRPVNIRDVVQMSRSIDFARFHNTYEVPDLESTPEGKEEHSAHSEEAAKPQLPHKTTQTQDSARSLYLARGSTTSDSLPHGDVRSHSGQPADDRPNVVDVIPAASAVSTAPSHSAPTQAATSLPSHDEIREALTVLSRLLASNGFNGEAQRPCQACNGGQADGQGGPQNRLSIDGVRKLIGGLTP
ncbi:hypothetical protein WJX73_005669 [Symbiochloris irregularis]|uniref:Inward rectifier potassium channel n=1 Tax=Symbiochloris irregularis TaxID=706552 RepID=A0AAW1P5B4_9CHLO